MLRGLLVASGVLAALPAMAGDMSAEEARRFVVGKLFSYNCFEGTRGSGRVFADGSVVGTVQFQGGGPVRRAFLPAGTLQVKGPAICASMRGLFIEPCFNLQRTDNNGFRGSVSGLGFAYCDFTRHRARINIASESEPTTATVSASRSSSKPLSLRPSMSASASPQN